MINRIYRRIYNKYFNFFKFLFFLRYVFTIFLIAIVLFFLIPKFFNYEKKQEIIKEYLINYYDLELNDYSTIKFKIFPFPNLSIKNVDSKIKNKSINLKSKNINIFLNFKNIYDYENFKAKKILFNDNEIILDIDKAKDLISYFNKLKYKLDIKILNLNLKKDDNLLIAIKNINFSNYGYRKYHINGEIFGKRFKAFLKDNNQNLNFKLLKTGVKAKFKFIEKNFNNPIIGSSKINLSNNFLKFDFNLNNDRLKIMKSNFRNKNLSISLNSLIKFKPFFSTNLDININEIDKNFIGQTDLKKILKNREFIKKLNGKININYKSKGYFSYLIEEYFSNLNLAYGRIVFSNKILIAGGEINCKGDSILIDQYPRLNFFCSFNLINKKEIFKKFSISKNINNDPLNLNIEGSLNLFNKKINFKKINIEKKYKANEEDLKFFKEKFEEILFDDGFFQIFKKTKIKKFLLEII